VVGTLTDVTDIKNAEERMLHDSVHDNLTGLPNRKLFIDRLGAVGEFRPRRCRNLRPTLMVIDLDRFQGRSTISVGIFGRRFHPADNWRGRLTPYSETAGHAGPTCRRSVRPDPDVGTGPRAHPPPLPRPSERPSAPPDRLQRTAKFSLTASIGLALSDPQTQLSEENHQGRRACDVIIPSASAANRIDVYKPAMRATQDRPADAGNQNCAAPSSARKSRSFYQPIVRPGRSLGSPASRRWHAGITPSSGGWRRRNSSISPKRSA